MLVSLTLCHVQSRKCPALRVWGVLSALVLFGVFVPLTPVPLLGGAKQIVASSRVEDFKARHILFTRSYLCGSEDHSESSGQFSMGKEVAYSVFQWEGVNWVANGAVARS